MEQGHKQPLDVDGSINAKNPYGYRDMTEVYESYPCEIQGGSIPAFLAGNYYKQTGAAFDVKQDTALLDGLAGITLFRIDGRLNKAYFSSTVLDQRVSRDYLESHGRVRRWTGTAGQGESNNLTVGDKLRVWFNNVMHKMGLSDKRLYQDANPNVVVWKLTDPEDKSSIFPAAATEADGTVLRFAKDNLKTIGPVSTMKPENGMVITTPAHYYEPLVRGTESSGHVRGGPYHIALEMSMKGYFPPTFTFTFGIYSGSSAPFKRVMGHPIATFSYTDRANQPLAKRPGYMHCYAQTNNYVIFFVSRMRLDYVKLLNQDFSRGFFGLFDPEEVPLEFMVFRINHHDLSKDELEFVGVFSDGITSCHVWHMSNAFDEEDGTITVDTSASERIGALTGSFMMRSKINLQTKTVTITKFRSSEELFNLEFPQANPLVHFSKYSFAYALENPGITTRSMAKLDVNTGQVVGRVYEGKDYILAEPVFVPRIRAYGHLSKEEELDGVVLLAVTDPREGRSWLAILNPSDLSEICRITSPQVINVGLHSHFFPLEPLISKY